MQRKAGPFTVTESRYAPEARIARHDHQLASLNVVLAGGYDEGFGRHRRRGDPGVVIIHPEGEHHDEVHDPVVATVLTIEIDSGFLPTLRPVTRMFDEPWHRTDFSFVTAAYRLRSTLTRGDQLSSVVIESTILEMIARLDASSLRDSSGAVWLLDVRDRLEAEFCVIPTMEALSEQAGVHPVHLARAFRRRFGCSVGDYVRRLQVGKAALMLEGGGEPLAAVAFEAGFADQSHMTRRVHAETGSTPGAWRQRGSRVGKG